MAKKPTLSTITNRYDSTPAINSNFDAIETAFENTLSRDGSTPNTMEADLDLNDNDILNAKAVFANSLVVNGKVIASQALYSSTLEFFEDLSSVEEADVPVGGLVWVTSTSSSFERAADAAGDAHYDYSGSGGVKWYEAGPNFSTRARAVAAHARNVAAGRSVPTGTVWSWPEGSIVYDGSGTRITSLSGWSAFPKSEMTFHDYEFIDSQQLAYAKSGDVSSQTVATVTSGIQALMAAAVDFLDGGSDRTAVCEISGRFAVNDEIFTEAAAQTIWDTVRTNCRLVLTGNARFEATSWPSHKAVRTSGLWSGVTDATPMALFRLENKTKSGFRLSLGAWEFYGEQATTDPIGIKLRNINDSSCQAGARVANFYNVGFFGEDFNNSDFYPLVVSRCGYQPTQAGGDGFIDSAVTFSTTAGSGTTTVTASASIFNADHVGKWFMVQDAGEGGTVFSGQITAQSGTTATLNAQCTTNVSGKKGSFVMLRGDTTGASASMSLSTAVTTDLTGRYAFVLGGGSPTHTDQDVIVSLITAHDSGSTGKAITLKEAPANTLSSTPIAIAPQFYLGRSEDADVSGHNNDCQFFGMRVEHSFNTTTGSALPFVFQNVLASQFYGCKGHGTDAAYNNFAAAEMKAWFDNCKHFVGHGMMFDHGEWSPDYGGFVVTGLTSQIRLSDTRTGNATPMDRTCVFYIAPQTSAADECAVFVSGRINSTGTTWGLSGQAVARYGSNGSASMLMADGPLFTRDQSDFPDMPAFPVRTLNVTSGWVTWTPELHIGGADIADNSGTYSARDASYKIVDDFAYVDIRIVLTAEGTGTGNVTIPLPAEITPQSDNLSVGVGDFAGFTGLTSGVFARTDASNGMELFRLDGASANSTPITHGNTTNTTRVEISGWFRIA